MHRMKPYVAAILIIPSACLLVDGFLLGSAPAQATPEEAIEEPTGLSETTPADPEATPAVSGDLPADPSLADPSIENPRDAYGEAIRNLQQGNVMEARDALEALLAHFQGDKVLGAKVRANLARANLALAPTSEDPRVHVEEALSLTAEAAEFDPNSSGVWNVRGRALLAAERAPEAMVAFRRAIEIDPDNLYAQNNLGYALILTGDAAQALTHLQAARGAGERSGATIPAYVFNNLGIVLESSGRFAEAEEAFGMAVGAGSEKASVNLARVESKMPETPVQAAADEPASAQPTREPESASEPSGFDDVTAASGASGGSK